MSTQEIASSYNLQELSTTYEKGQYTLWQILGIWALVSLPMALLAWVVALAIIPYSPLHPGITYWLLTIAGMVWQFVVSLAIIDSSEYNFLNFGDSYDQPCCWKMRCLSRR